MLTFVARVAEYFRARPNEWVDGRALASVGGAYAWRSRVADVRRAPFNLNVVNRQRRVHTDRGIVIVSEYMNVAPDDSTRPAA